MIGHTKLSVFSGAISARAFAACAVLALATPGPVHAGMVVGTVVLSPGCPGPMRQGKPCGRGAIAATVDIFRSAGVPSASDKPVMRVTSDAAGHFRVKLAPASYWFVAHALGDLSRATFAKPVSVDVGDGTVMLTLPFDSGMR